MEKVTDGRGFFQKVPIFKLKGEIVGAKSHLEQITEAMSAAGTPKFQSLDQSVLR